MINALPLKLLQPDKFTSRFSIW